MQPEFIRPDFIESCSAEEIHQRMMNNLPADIDTMPGGFPYDFTKPAAEEIDEFINYYLVRSLMIAFPQYAWDEWLDLHGQQVHLERNQPKHASGKVRITGIEGTVIKEGTVFCTPATESGPSIEFCSQEDTIIGEDGVVSVSIAAVEGGTSSNVAANTIILMAKANKSVIEVTNPEPVRGGTERESNDDFYDRIAMEYRNSLTYLGNDSDYIRWAREVGAGDCIVIPAAEGPGTVKLVLVDGNGQPANDKLVQEVYNYIVSPEDRSKRLLPTACAKLICGPATMVKINFEIVGLLYDETTNLEQIQNDFMVKVREVYVSAKSQGVLRYNDVRPIIKSIIGITDFDEFLMNKEIKNIKLGREEYPETGSLDFS